MLTCAFCLTRFVPARSAYVPCPGCGLWLPNTLRGIMSKGWTHHGREKEGREEGRRFRVLAPATCEGCREATARSEIARSNDFSNGTRGARVGPSARAGRSVVLRYCRSEAGGDSECFNVRHHSARDEHRGYIQRRDQARVIISRHSKEPRPGWPGFFASCVQGLLGQPHDFWNRSDLWDKAGERGRGST